MVLETGIAFITCIKLLLYNVDTRFFIFVTSAVVDQY